MLNDMFDRKSVKLNLLETFRSMRLIGVLRFKFNFLRSSVNNELKMFG